MWNFINTYSTVIIILVFWVSLTISKRMGTKIGFVSILLAPAFYLYLHWFFTKIWVDESGYTWVGKSLYIVLLMLIMFVLNTIHRLENSFIQDKRNSQALSLSNKIFSNKLAKKPIPDFSLYLRPFAFDKNLSTQSPDSGIEASEFGQQNIEIEFLIAKIHDDIHPLIALGRPEGTDGAGRIQTEHETWKSKATALIEEAKAIYIAPSYQAGTLWEIKLLIDHGLFGKCIWIMPETTGRGGFSSRLNGGVPELISYHEYFDFQGNWKKTVEEVAKLGIVLPNYELEGLVFKIEPNGQIIKSEKINMQKHFNKLRRMKLLIKSIEAVN